MEILGIDIGGSGIKGAIVDTLTGELSSERYRIDTPKPADTGSVAKVINQIVSHFQWSNDVGCTFPSVINNGKALYSSNLDDSWKGQQVDDLFSEYCSDLKFSIINDADAAAIAEQKFGALKNKSGLAMLITVGTGLGSGVFYNGVLIPNFELGRLFGKDGDLIEFYAADSARKKEDLSYKEWGKRFDFFLQHIVRICSPDHIVIGGGASKKIHKFRKYLTVDVPIRASETRNNAGIIGAAIFAAEHVR